MRATPDEVRLILVDPKRVELADYNGMPHLYVPVITEADRAIAALKWAVGEMEMRYRKFAGATARNIASYNETRADPADRLPYIVIIVDELADLMMRKGRTVEDPIVRLAQKARATGIHLVLATQRPSVNVVTGLIKANFPSRIAFAMASQIDSRTILDAPGAEDLIGRGDMLFQPSDLPRPIRLQGVFVADREIRAVTAHWRAEAEPHYDLGDHRERRGLHRIGRRRGGRRCRPAPAGCRRRGPGVRSRLGVAAAATPQDRVRPCGADHRPARGARLHRAVRRLERAPGPSTRSGQRDGTPGCRRWGRQMTTRDHARPAGGEQDREPIADRRPRRRRRRARRAPGRCARGARHRPPSGRARDEDPAHVPRGARAGRLRRRCRVPSTSAASSATTPSTSASTRRRRSPSGTARRRSTCPSRSSSSRDR